MNLEDRIEKLEKELKELKLQQKQELHYHYYTYSQPYYTGPVLPMYPYVEPNWTITCGSGTTV